MPEDSDSKKFEEYGKHGYQRWPAQGGGQPSAGDAHSPSQWNRQHKHEAEKNRKVFQANYFLRWLIFILEVVIPYSLCVDIADYAPNLSFVLFFGWLGFNNVYLQGKTGQTLGKKLFNCRLAYVIKDPFSEVTAYHCQPSIARCAVREVAHFLDIVLGTGIWLPIFNANGRTLADVITQTSVLRSNYPVPINSVDEVRADIAAKNAWNRGWNS